MVVYLAIFSSKWGDDYTIYGVCGNREIAIQKLLSAISRPQEDMDTIYDKLKLDGEYIQGSDVYRIEEWEVEI